MIKRHNVCIQDPFQHDFLVGGSCTTKKSERVVALIKTSAEICQSEEELTDPNTSTFLNNLFSCELVDCKAKFNVKLNELAGFAPEKVSEDVFQMLEDILTKIMKFQVEKNVVMARPQGEPDSKVPKTSEKQDVHQQNDDETFAADYQCVSLHPVWRARKKSRGKVKLAFPETAFEFETKLSDVIVSQEKPPERVEFLCSAVLKKTFSLEIFLRQLEGRNRNNCVVEIFEYLRNTLPSWMRTFLCEKLGESSTLASTQPEPCSSTAHHAVGMEDSDNSEGGLLQPEAQKSGGELETQLEEAKSEVQTEADLDARMEVAQAEPVLQSQSNEAQLIVQTEAEFRAPLEEAQSEPQAEVEHEAQLEKAQSECTALTGAELEA